MTTQAVKKAPVPLTCKRLIKDDNLQKVVCNKRFVKGRCGNEKVHISKYKTGWCAQGWCEGQNPKTFAGNPAPTCKSWQTCGCDCHDMYDLMFSMSGQARIVVNNSEYHPPKGEFRMPTVEERIAMHTLSKPGQTNTPKLIESPLPDAVPATIARSFGPTATGRAARGELESWVKDQCDIWIVEAEDFPCTPQYLSEEIGRTQGIKPPSVGAISAVFERWVKMGFATIDKKPTRFTAYTQQGIELGLDGCKDKARRGKKLTQAASARTLR